MDAHKPPEYVLEIFADPQCLNEVVSAVLHTIFFHRYFSSIRPSTFEVLDYTIPVVTDQELQILIETRAGQLFRQLSPNASANNRMRGKLNVLFYEKKRKKAGAGLGWFGAGKTEEDIVWEKWTLEVTLATPHTEDDRNKFLKAAGSSLQKSMFKIIKIVNRDKAHIPAITSNEVNPFPYKIDITPRVEGWR